MPGNQPQTVPHHWLPKPAFQAVPHHWLPKPVSHPVHITGCPSQFLKPFHMLVAQASIPSRFTSLVAQASIPSRSTCWLPKPVSHPVHMLVAQPSIPSVHITGCPSQSLSYKLNHYSRNGIESRNEMYRKARNMGTLHFTNSSCHMCERIQVEKDPIRISMMHALFT